CFYCLDIILMDLGRGRERHQPHLKRGSYRLGIRNVKLIWGTGKRFWYRGLISANKDVIQEDSIKDHSEPPRLIWSSSTTSRGLTYRG
ncbi:MAG: hypothetical protein P8M80_13580, partial [Pirellulaceae bacterium]|nr:hypothetical protein [Pirellulaceae bacterium]